jgi:hypothetical protein
MSRNSDETAALMDAPPVNEYDYWDEPMDPLAEGYSAIDFMDVERVIDAGW